MITEDSLSENHNNDDAAKSVASENTDTAAEQNAFGESVNDGPENSVQSEKKPMQEQLANSEPAMNNGTAQEFLGDENPDNEENKQTHAAEAENSGGENGQAIDQPKDNKENSAKETELSAETETIDSNAGKEQTSNGQDNAEDKKSNPENAPDFSAISLSEVLAEMESIINKEDAATHFRRFNQLKEAANHKIEQENNALKADFVQEGNPEELYSAQHPAQAKLSGLLSIFREKAEEHQRQHEQQQAKHLEQRQAIIEKLKNLYTNTEPGTNLFKAIREIKEEWKSAGQVAKSEFKLLNNNYFHHLNQFYQMLDLNKEYMEQEFAHNLEKRNHIIERAKQLETEPSVQKALNELQYLHKLWKEEAEPVAEEFREKTWDEFKEISNRIHERKSELTEQIAKEQSENLVRKNAIIAELEKLATTTADSSHSYWQQAIKKVEDLRSEFLRLGNVPRKVSNQNWNEFKQHLRNFNVKKNAFYKNLKSSQQANLDAKLALIQTAKDNMMSEDWETAVPLFKKLQEDWKQIGHVPRSMTNKVWDNFREACNVFFKNYREKNNTSDDNWRENYKNKRQLLDELKEIGSTEGSVSRIEEIKTRWNTIGKVPREKLSINTEFNKTLREKLKLNKISEYDLKDEGLSENQLTDKARKMKNQIADLEAEVVKMENNLGFFSNPSRDNPMLAETYEKIDSKKAQIDSLKQNLHTIVVGEN